MIGQNQKFAGSSAGLPVLNDCLTFNEYGKEKGK